MKQCIDCGQTFVDNLDACPNCGCPASMSPVIVQPLTNAHHQQQANYQQSSQYAKQSYVSEPKYSSYETTDTGINSGKSMNILKIIRSILLAAIGSILIGLGTNEANFSKQYDICQRGIGIVDNTWIKVSGPSDMEQFFVILVGAALIVCAIPTDFKKKG